MATNPIWINRDRLEQPSIPADILDRCASGHGISLQLKPAQRRDFTGQVCLCSGWLADGVRSRSPHPAQMRLANAYCRYLELAHPI